ncbi:hypothetical protein JD844_002642 [Phrynosoma platyrhinos]|uniref:Acyloxyacyl hydrolase n=1 Tax=Phrynosoma platyrhinos TaxID=52577 RepID=A0ABQ7TBS2_PHRPL|nr:hypothetical protein JD844_002642 [Phrynosoma platyrhinos]
MFLSHSFIKHKLPYEDFDGDKFSIFPPASSKLFQYPSCFSPDEWDAKVDSNCNGIWGVDPKDGIPYEQKFCNGTESKGVIILGDSAAAHFHIPPEWVTASQVSKKAFSNLPEAFTNELDWPQFSEATGFLKSTIGSPDTVKHMTQPKEMHTNVLQTLRNLDSYLPKGSHVILIGLVDGRFLWDNLHDRYYPLGQLNKDVTYEQFYSFLNCLQRASQLSSVLKEIAKFEKYTNFDVFYMDYPIKEIAEMWQKIGGEAWQLIEAVDGFHPSQIASALGSKTIWEKILHKWPHVFGKENPFNSEIETIFKDQGGH